MRSKKATRYNSVVEHNQFGIYNWFRLKGVTNKEVMYETIQNFCQDNGFYMDGFNFSKGKEQQICNWVANRFKLFATYSGKFLRDNNYIPHSHKKV